MEQSVPPQYPLTNQPHYVMERKGRHLAHITMHGEDETLGHLFQSIFQGHPGIDLSTFRLNHLFVEDLQTKQKICTLFLTFKGSPSKALLAEHMEKWYQDVFVKNRNACTAILSTLK